MGKFCMLYSVFNGCWHGFSTVCVLYRGPEHVGDKNPKEPNHVTVVLFNKDGNFITTCHVPV